MEVTTVQIRLSRRNSNKKLSLSFKLRGCRSLRVMRYGCCASGFRFNSHLANFGFVFLLFSGLCVMFRG